MVPPRGCEYTFSVSSSFLRRPWNADIFIGLNAVRVLSIVGLILVFSSSIFVITEDIRAVDAFQDLKQSGNSTADLFEDCDYIM
jgi:hypothetical protein